MSHKLPFLKYYPDINNYANKFLATYNKDNIIPLPIEEIVEFKLGINLLLIPGLQSGCGFSGFISSDMKTITVDEELYSHPKNQNRYRFTLAHEVGHSVIHRDILEEANYDNIDGFHAFISSLGKEHSGYEFHAHSFAGLILAPQNLLLNDLKMHLVNLLEEEPSMIPTYLGYSLSSKYKISSSAIQTRLRREIQHNENLRHYLGFNLYDLLVRSFN